LANTTKKRKEKKSVYEGNVYIQATFNNTIVTVTDLTGNTLSWASSGGLGFRGAKNLLRLPLSLLQKQLFRRLRVMACVKFTYL
jgi:hypothetical protein